jgi:hypothetical protein
MWVQQIKLVAISFLKNLNIFYLKKLQQKKQPPIPVIQREL